MAKSRFIQSSFVSGELSPLLKGRVDINQYYQAAETADNVVIVPQGGMKRRPGTEFIAQTTRSLVPFPYTGTMPNGGTASVLYGPVDTPTTSTTVGIGTTNEYVVVKADKGAVNIANIEFIDVRQISLSTGTSDEFKIQYSSDDVTYTDAADVPLIGTNPQNFRIKIGIYARYWRLVRIGTTNLGPATLSLAVFNLIQETGVDSECKLEDFSIEDDRHYLVEFSRDNIAIFRSQLVGLNIQTTRVADIRPTYGSSVDVSTVRTAQTENVMLIVGNFEPMRLVNLGTDSDWFLDNIPFTNVPQYDFDDDQSPTPRSEIQVMDIGHGGGTWKKGERFEFDIEGVTSKSITFAGDATPDERAATVFNIQKNLQDMPIFGETGVSVQRTGALVYTITISGESAKEFELFAAYITEGSTSHEIEFTKTQSGVPRKEDVWSNTRGWPRSMCFYEGRLVIGGTQSKPQSIFMSKSGAFFDFDIDDGDDDEAIFATISARKLNDIVDVYPGRNLQIFTSGAEFAITSKPATPSNINIQPQTSHGASNIEVQDVDGSTLFVDRHGKSLLSFLYSFNEDAYTTDDRSVLASHLINQPVDMALLAGTASDDANWLFIVNSDGTATILNTLRSQDINGFTSWSTSGKIKSACVVDDQLFMTVERSVNGADKLYLERWDFDYRMDCAIKSSQIAGVIDDLDHLEGETVKVVTREGYQDAYENIVLSSYTVASGAITLDQDERYFQVTYEVGLPFTCTIKPMPLNTNIGSGQNQMRLTKIVRMNVRVYESYGIKVDDLPTTINEFGPFVTGGFESIVPQSGIIEDVYDINGWGRGVMPTITAPDPLPMHIQMIEYEIEGN